MTEEFPNIDSIEIREGLPSDHNFIYSTWLNGLYYGNSWFKLTPKHEFMKFYHQIIERLLARSAIRIACLKEDRDVILGYAVIEGNVLHWTHTKPAWRKLKIARNLTITNGITSCTHLTDLAVFIFSKQKDWEFNPFLI